MNRLKVGTRLAVLTGLLGFFAIVSGLLGLTGMAVATRQLETVYEDRTVALVQLASVLYDTLSIRRQIDVAEAAQTREQLNLALDKVVKLDARRERSWYAYLRTRRTPEEEQLINLAEIHRVQLAKARSEVIAAFRNNGSSAGMAAISSTGFDRVYDALHADISRLIDLQARVAGEQYDAARQSCARLRTLMAAVLACGVLLGIGTAWLLARSVIRPLATAIAIAHSIAEGDFAVVLPSMENNEFGQLLRALAKMRDGLRTMSDEIRARVRQLEEMSNALPLAVFQLRVSPDGQYAYNFIGEPVSAILGVPAGELMADPLARWRHVHPADQQQAQDSAAQLIGRAANGWVGTSEEIVTRVLIEGETRLVYSTACAFEPSPDGAVTISGYYQDVTEHRRSQQLLQDVLDACPSVVFVKDLAGKYVLTNRAFDDVMRLPPGSSIGRTDQEIFPNDVAQRIRDRDSAVIATGTVRHFEEDIPVAAGMRMYSSIKFPLRDVSGQPYALCGITNDVTERLEMESALRDSEAYNRVLFQESHVPMLVIDPASGRLADCNTVAVGILGYASKTDVIGKTTLDLSAPIQHAGETSPIQVQQRSSFAARRSLFEWRLVRPDGEIWDASVHQSMCHHRDMPAAMMLCTLEDITVRKTAERQREDALHLLSHDMRSPHASILALVQITRTQRGPERLPELLGHIERCAQRALTLADDFVQLARAESQVYMLEAVSLHDLLLDASDEVWPQAYARRIALDVHDESNAGERCWIRADRSLLTRALVNILNNAVKYSASDTRIICTFARQHGLSARVLCTIRDEGYGIPIGKQVRLFERFQRFHEAQRPDIGGAGLGMAFIKTVVTRHGGDVHVESMPGKGTAFTVSLPVLEEDAALSPEDSVTLTRR